MDRREFCRRLSLVGGSVALAPLLKACAQGPEGAPPEATAPLDTARAGASTPTPRPTGTPEPTGEPQATEGPLQPTDTPAPTDIPQAVTVAGQAAVALVVTDDRAEGVRRALALLGVNPARGNRVLLKPNFNSADPAPGSTHPDILRTLAEELLDMGARSITVGERSGMGDTRQVMEQKGMFDLAAALGLDTLVFDELAETDWLLQRSGDFHWVDGFAVPRALLDSECVVQTCNLKTHRYGGHFTLSLKNSVGLAAKQTAVGGHDYMRELHNSRYQREMIAEINTAYQPGLILMDGVEAFVNGGPAQGKMVAPRVVLAATDRVAMDAVGVAILRMFGTTPEVSRGAIFEQAQIARAAEMGLGVDGPEKIRLLFEDEAGEAFGLRVRQQLAA